MKLTKIGYTIGVIGTIIILLWIGVLKFTPSEAEAIKPYVENSFLMSWMYKIGTVQQVSVFIGIWEIITAILLIGSFFTRLAGIIGGYLGLAIFSNHPYFYFYHAGYMEGHGWYPYYRLLCVKGPWFFSSCSTGNWDASKKMEQLIFITKRKIDLIFRLLKYFSFCLNAWL